MCQGNLFAKNNTNMMPREGGGNLIWVMFKAETSKLTLRHKMLHYNGQGLQSTCMLGPN